MEETRTLPGVDRLIARSLTISLSWPARYAVATGLLVVVAVLRVTLVTNLLPYLMYIPAVLAISLLMDGTGLYAAALSTVLAGITIADRRNPLWLTDQQWLACLLYLLVMALVTVAGEKLRDAFRRNERLVAERAAVHARLVEREHQLQLLNGELGHRLKNLLTVVQAVSSQTLRRSADLPAASEALTLRLAAIGRATDMLTAREWEGALLSDVVGAAVGHHDDRADRIRLDGPAIRLGAQVALALALVFHELSTNAAKYGALSVPAGRVAVRWRVEPDGELHLAWQEENGPAVTPPTRHGFGSRLIDRSLKAYFPGGSAVSYDPAGLVFRMNAALTPGQVEIA